METPRRGKDRHLLMYDENVDFSDDEDLKGRETKDLLAMLAEIVDSPSSTQADPGDVPCTMSPRSVDSPCNGTSWASQENHSREMCLSSDSMVAPGSGLRALGEVPHCSSEDCRPDFNDLEEYSTFPLRPSIELQQWRSRRDQLYAEEAVLARRVAERNVAVASQLQAASSSLQLLRVRLDAERKAVKSLVWCFEQLRRLVPKESATNPEADELSGRQLALTASLEKQALLLAELRRERTAATEEAASFQIVCTSDKAACSSGRGTISNCCAPSVLFRAPWTRSSKDVLRRDAEFADLRKQCQRQADYVAELRMATNREEQTQSAVLRETAFFVERLKHGGLLGFDDEARPRRRTGRHRREETEDEAFAPSNEVEALLQVLDGSWQTLAAHGAEVRQARNQFLVVRNEVVLLKSQLLEGQAVWVEHQDNWKKACSAHKRVSWKTSNKQAALTQIQVVASATRQALVCEVGALRRTLATEQVELERLQRHKSQRQTFWGACCDRRRSTRGSGVSHGVLDTTEAAQDMEAGALETEQERSSTQVRINTVEEASDLVKDSEETKPESTPPQVSIDRVASEVVISNEQIGFGIRDDGAQVLFASARRLPPPLGYGLPSPASLEWWLNGIEGVVNSMRSVSSLQTAAAALEEPSLSASTAAMPPATRSEPTPGQEFAALSAPLPPLPAPPFPPPGFSQGIARRI